MSPASEALVAARIACESVRLRAAKVTRRDLPKMVERPTRKMSQEEIDICLQVGELASARDDKAPAAGRYSMVTR